MLKITFRVGGWADEAATEVDLDYAELPAVGETVMVDHSRVEGGEYRIAERRWLIREGERELPNLRPVFRLERLGK
jgi:hypothetical protein